MPAKAIELDGKRYVILPEEEYEAMLQVRNGDETTFPDDPMTEEEERALIELVERNRQEGGSRPFEDVCREMGLQ